MQNRVTLVQLLTLNQEFAVSTLSLYFCLFLFIYFSEEAHSSAPRSIPLSCFLRFPGCGSARPLGLGG
jgi:hypothetical protein